MSTDWFDLVEIGTPLQDGELPQGRQPSSGDIRHFLHHEIAVGTLAAGQKLPTERQLAERFGVSRTIVRDALTCLEADGQISRHVGKGTFVSGTTSKSYSLDALAGTSPIKLIEARNVIESELAALAVMNATEADIQRIAFACDALESAPSIIEFELRDSEFHAAIARATHNELLCGAYALISEARDHPEWKRLKERRHTARPERRFEVHREHRAILEALTDRDAPGARSAMLHHLANVRSNLLGC